ncbi:hypothetical protein ACRS8P_19105 [Burkholderia cenocepacia]
MKERVIGVLLCSVAAGMSHAQTQPDGNPPNSNERAAAIQRAFNPTARIDEYKTRIDFDRKFSADDGRMIVAFDWSTLATAQVSGLQTLKIEHAEQHVYETGPLKTIREYVFNGDFDGARVSITIAQGRDRFAAADYFFHETTSSSTTRVPFETGPAGLGSVSVQSVAGRPGRGFVWIYKNLCFVVSSASADAARDLGQCLQALAEAHTVNADGTS